MGLKILAENGVVNPMPGQCYRQRAWLDSLKAIAAKLGPSTLRAIGKRSRVTRSGRRKPR